MRTCCSTLLVLAILLTGAELDARSRRKASVRSGNSFDYYLLALSYAPDFCDQPTGRKDPQECGPGRKLGFVVHGLWPQSNTGTGPQNCGGSPVSASLVQLMLNYLPSASLIQHEWTTHGTCSGLSAADYFALVRKARDSVKIPPDLANPSAANTVNTAAIDAKFAAANPSFAASSFRATCYGDGELQDVRICLNKDLSPKGCTASVRDCAKPQITINPVR